MHETVVCVVGNVATAPVYRELAAGPSLRFRLAATARYWDREKSTWTDGHTNFFTVWANRQLAANAMASVEVGQPLVVQGWLKVRTDGRDGQQQWASADIDATAIGHDLSRVRRSSVARANRNPLPGPPGPSPTGRLRARRTQVRTPPPNRPRNQPQ